ncbi:hypothetical protein L2E82_06412 [Cichorium intybus]|uniref:Uncharacterized protein n=1 Tax=Cichorium intybus TaxID=13427 RepID=A0ACB9HBH0_CICIN|nr:hypothetical protein L2E82_06412 [Cichorium intybus]
MSKFIRLTTFLLEEYSVLVAQVFTVSIPSKIGSDFEIFELQFSINDEKKLLDDVSWQFCPSEKLPRRVGLVQVLLEGFLANILKGLDALYNLLSS